MHLAVTAEDGAVGRTRSGAVERLAPARPLGVADGEADPEGAGAVEQGLHVWVRHCGFEIASSSRSVQQPARKEGGERQFREHHQLGAGAPRPRARRACGRRCAACRRAGCGPSARRLGGGFGSMLHPCRVKRARAGQKRAGAAAPTGVLQGIARRGNGGRRRRPASFPTAAAAVSSTSGGARAAR